MSREKKQTLPIDFSGLSGKKVGHPVVDGSRKEPIDFSGVGGRKVGQALKKIIEESDTE